MTEATGAGGVSSGDFEHYILLLRRNVKILLAAFVGGVLLAVLLINVSPKIYTTSMVVKPASGLVGSSTVGSMPSIGGILGSALGGSASEVTPYDQFSATIHSRVLAEKIFHDHPELVKTIFKSEILEESGEFHEPFGLGFILRRTIGKVLAFPKWQPPSPGRMKNYLSNNVKVLGINSSGMTTIEIEGANPELGRYILNLVFVEADNLVRAEQAQNSRIYISYLTDQLAEVVLVEHRQALTDLLSEQQKSLMLAEVDLSYSASIFDPPTSSDSPTSPKPFILLILCIVTALLCTVIWMFMKPGREAR